MNKDNEEIIKKLEQIAFILAAGDGISAEESSALETLPAKLRGFFTFKKAVQEFEKSNDLKKAMKHVKEGFIMHHVMGFGTPEHIDEVITEIAKIAESDSSREEYNSYIKLLASGISDDFDQKIAMVCIEDVLLEDGLSSFEGASMVVLSRCWGVTKFGASKWFTANVVPLIEEADKLWRVMQAKEEYSKRLRKNNSLSKYNQSPSSKFEQRIKLTDCIEKYLCNTK